MASRKYPNALFWIDIEATGVTPANSFDEIQILEVGIIVTDFDLKPYFGYQAVVQMNDDIKAQLGLPQNKEALDMHVKNGLLKDSKESTDTLRTIESEVIGMLKNKTSFDKGEFMVAGSGVAAYDFPLLQAQMPELASWFNYASLDIGQVRRAAYYLSGRRDVVAKVPESFKEGEKAHRALSDIKAHIKEANVWKHFFLDEIERQTTEEN